MSCFLPRAAWHKHIFGNHFSFFLVIELLYFYVSHKKVISSFSMSRNQNNWEL